MFDIEESIIEHEESFPEDSAQAYGINMKRRMRMPKMKTVSNSMSRSRVAS